MKPKTIKVLYWVLTILLVIAFLGDAIAGIVREKTGAENMRHLGYPIYSMTIIGTAKLLGALAIIQTKFYTIKEWAFAGFTISFIGAFLSRVYVGDGIGLLMPPVILLAIMFADYFLWKKYLTLKGN